MNSRILRSVIEIFDDENNRGIGISRTISISNTIKIIARRKNRIENGVRALWLGSKPHSNGEDFSREEIDRVDKIQARENTSMQIPIAEMEEIMIIFIN